MRALKSGSPSPKRKPSASGCTTFHSTRRVHMRVSARSAAFSPISAGLGLLSSMYSQIATVSAITRPSSSSSAGIWPDGFFER
jgi:hypothetical protein